jgi:hypothetical protein
MTDDRNQMLSDVVHISRHYQRSIRIDSDLGKPEALEGYICHATARAVIEGMSKQLLENNQRSFTWTGPFGGGKSSLAVAFASALAPYKPLRSKARELLRVNELPAFDKAFPSKRGWMALPIVGKRASVVSELARTLRRAQGLPAESRKTASATLIADLLKAAESPETDGVLIVIDEMGKFLEASAMGTGDDVYFFQELAEAAGRAQGKLVVVGILHQSFGQYAARLGIDTREDWSKVQGRYADIPLVAASDEVVELLGRAIESRKRPSWTLEASQAVSKSIKSRRPAVGEDFHLRLNACWPLHPAMAALLGPISKRQFGQNERSVFGFLASIEPHGFRDYLQTTRASHDDWYRPDHYWDYLRANLEPAILASPDGHRWAQAAEAVERAEAKATDKLDVALIKNIAIIDLFRNGSGLAADVEALSAIFYKTPKKQVEASLDRLAHMRVALFKKHIGAWSVFEGSDFDIDQAVWQSRSTLPGLDFELLSSLANLYPVIAKRHYHQTGTMRWMDMALCRLEDAGRLAERFKPRKGEFGLFLLALPSRSLSGKAAAKLCEESGRMDPWPVAVSVPANHAKIEGLGAELLALQHVQSRHELEGDSVARREVLARISSVRSNLEDQLRAAVTNAEWRIGSRVFEAGPRLTQFASDFADDVYKSAPEVWSELVNRESPSSNSVKARRDLMHRMLTHEAVENLGIDGFPAERGLFETLLRKTELHREGPDGVFGFYPPDEGNAQPFWKLWEATRAMFADSGARVSVADIHEKWSLPPYGVRDGVKPVILCAFLLAHKSNVALYKDGFFIPRLTDADLDEYLQDASRFSMRWIQIDEAKSSILAGISKILAEVGAASEARDPLEAARGLVALVFGLPAWSQRTSNITVEARGVRDTLLKASDPHKVLFVDLAALLESSGGASYVDALRAPIAELAGAYDALLKQIEASMFEALDAPADRLDRLRARAEAVAGVTGHLRQDAFAARLAAYDGSKMAIEGILSLAANKPPRDWIDRDIDTAMLDIAQSAARFRQSEAFVSVRGRAPNSEAFAVVIGAGAQTRTLTREFSVSDRHRERVDTMARDLAAKLQAEGLDTDVLLAVLARAGMRLTSTENEQGEKSYG